MFVSNICLPLRYSSHFFEIVLWLCLQSSDRKTTVQLITILKILINFQLNSYLVEVCATLKIMLIGFYQL